jgi:hypothetical protein
MVYKPFLRQLIISIYKKGEVNAFRTAPLGCTYITQCSDWLSRLVGDGDLGIMSIGKPCSTSVEYRYNLFSMLHRNFLSENLLCLRVKGDIMCDMCCVNI